MGNRKIPKMTVIRLPRERDYGDRDRVYAYFFRGRKAAYVGRTVNPARRDWQHRQPGDNAVRGFADKNGLRVPEMTLLEDGLSPGEGLEREDFWCKKLKGDGWRVLNKAKTGVKSGSLGRLGGEWRNGRFGRKRFSGKV